MDCYRCLVLVMTTVLAMVVPRHAEAQSSSSNAERIDALARQLEATQAELKQTKAELQTLRPHDVGHVSWDGADGRLGAPGCGPGLNYDVGLCGSECDTCTDCGQETCQGLSHLCARCKEQLSWTKGPFRIVPYGAIISEGISSGRTIALRGSPLYLAPGPAPGIDDSRFTVSGQQSIVGANITGPDFGSFQSGANVAVNFFGEQPVQNNPGLFFLFAYAELKNDNWRFWVGQAPDAIGRQNTNSPAWSSHKMSGNFGQLRPGFRVERFFSHSQMLGTSLYFGLTQQAVNDFIAVPGVSGIDNGWPNVELRWEMTLGQQAESGQRPILFALGGLIGETRAVDDFAIADINVSTSWAVIPELRIEMDRWGFQGEGFVGQAMGTYNGAIGQSLNPVNGEAIYGVGAFGELFWKINSCFTASIGYGIDDPLDRDLGVVGGILGQRTRNEKYWANYIWRHSEQWETRFEVSHLETGYLGTTRNSQSMIYHFLAKYTF